MKRLVPITRGGQISLPAEVRHRWEAEKVAIQDFGEYLVIKPVPADPIAAALGRFPLRSGRSLDQLTAEYRLEEVEADDRSLQEFAKGNHLRVAE